MTALCIITKGLLASILYRGFRIYVVPAQPWQNYLRREDESASLLSAVDQTQYFNHGMNLSTNTDDNDDDDDNNNVNKLCQNWCFHI